MDKSEKNKTANLSATEDLKVKKPVADAAETQAGTKADTKASSAKAGLAASNAKAKAAASSGARAVKSKRPRRRGRPPKQASPIHEEAGVSRDMIINRAVELSKTMPLDQISMVQLAREFGVAPGLIHYYLGGRDNLISGVINRYYRERMESMPSLTGCWRSDVKAIIQKSFEVGVQNPGVSLYVASHNRYRLFQKVAPGEVDYGLSYFNHLTTAFKQGGFTAEQVALAYHLMAQFMVSSTMAEAAHQLPAYHRGFILEKLGHLPSEQYPGAHFVRSAFVDLSSEQAFNTGIDILLDGFEAWLGPKSNR